MKEKKISKELKSLADDSDTTKIDSSWQSVYENFVATAGTTVTSGTSSGLADLSTLKITYAAPNEDTIISKLAEIETRMMKIELALVHVIPYVLEKINLDK